MLSVMRLQFRARSALVVAPNATPRAPFLFRLGFKLLHPPSKHVIADEFISIRQIGVSLAVEYDSTCESGDRELRHSHVAYSKRLIAVERTFIQSDQRRTIHRYQRAFARLASSSGFHGALHKSIVPNSAFRIPHSPFESRRRAGPSSPARARYNKFRRPDQFVFHVNPNTFQNPHPGG